jgi:hypothetical protein
LQIEAVQAGVACELGAVVEGDCSAQLRWDGLQQLLDQFGDEIGGFVIGPGGEQDA